MAGQPGQGIRRAGVPIAVFVILGVALLVAGVYQYRSYVAGAVPGAREAMSAVGMSIGSDSLEFRKPDFVWTDPDKKDRLTVMCEVVNTGAAAQAVPLIRIALLDEQGVEVYAQVVGLKQRRLLPGGSTSLNVEVDDPPQSAVAIRFEFVDGGTE